MVTEEEVEVCTLCGRLFSLDVLIWSGQAGAFLCPDCFAEEEGCGCEDV